MRSLPIQIEPAKDGAETQPAEVVAGDGADDEKKLENCHSLN